MSRFSELFHIDVKHEFFASARIPKLRLIPGRSTQRKIANLGLLHRQTPFGCTVFHDVQHPNALRHSCDDPGEPLVLVYFGKSGAENFSVFTDSSPGGTSSVFCLSNEPSHPARNSYQMLHASEFVSDDDVAVHEELACWSSDLSPVLPDFIVCIRIGNVTEAVSLDQMFETAPTYRISFAARQTRWKYFLTGASIGSKYRVVAQPEFAQFIEGGTERLPGSGHATTFVSVQQIPFQERYDEIPQLHTGDSGNRRLIIRELPVARANCQSIAASENDGELISEIYINY